MTLKNTTPIQRERRKHPMIDKIPFQDDEEVGRIKTGWSDKVKEEIRKSKEKKRNDVVYIPDAEIDKEWVKPKEGPKP